MKDLIDVKVKLILIFLALSMADTSVTLQERQREIRIFNLYIIVDFHLYQEMRGKSLSVEKRIELIIKNVNKIYAPLRVQFRVVQIDIWAIELLTDTSEYYIPHELKLYKAQFANIRHDCLHLFKLRNSVLKRQGFGEKFAMCSKGSCVGYTIDSINQRIVDTAFVMAHELGHNFGLNHDTSYCGCTSCVMSTAMEISSRNFNWSKCSATDLESVLYYGTHACKFPNTSNSTIKITYITDRWSRSSGKVDIVSLNTSYCGNGIVEDHEECDCLEKQEDCKLCCDTGTCRFKYGAKCASGPCCNTTTCKVMARGEVCRPASDLCDLPEYCGGITESCGSNLYRSNNTPCKTQINESAFCFEGKCQNHLTQCRFLWGDSAKVSDVQCYLGNSGNNHTFKNCGDSRMRKSDVSFNDRPIPCEKGNEICGRLWCDHQNERLMALGSSESFSYMDGTNFCQAVKFELDWEMDDIGMVPDGSTCGNNKVCSNRKCIDAVVDDCKCGIHGVCDNMHQCHCEPGYNPPYCNTEVIITTPITSEEVITITLTKGFTSTSKMESNISNTLSNTTSQRQPSHTKKISGLIGTVVFLILLIMGIGLYKISKILIIHRALSIAISRVQPNAVDTISQISFNAAFLKPKLIKEINRGDIRRIIRKISEEGCRNKYQLVTVIKGTGDVISNNYLIEA